MELRKPWEDPHGDPETRMEWRRLLTTNSQDKIWVQVNEYTALIIDIDE